MEVELLTSEGFASLVSEELDLTLPPDWETTDLRDIPIDSICMIELLMITEEATGISIPEEAVASFVNLGDLYRWCVAAPAAGTPLSCITGGPITSAGAPM
jgi:acyl carrier protein